MNYELHKTTEDGYDTIATLANLVRELSSVTIGEMAGKYEIDITIKRLTDYDSKRTNDKRLGILGRFE